MTSSRRPSRIVARTLIEPNWATCRVLERVYIFCAVSEDTRHAWESQETRSQSHVLHEESVVGNVVWVGSFS